MAAPPGALALIHASPLALPAASSGALAQEPGGASRPIPRIDEFVHDGDLAEWRSRAVDRMLAPRPNGVEAAVWVGQVAGGLVVAAEMRAPDARAAIPALEVALADREPPLLPPIGWGHQFGFERLAGEEGCDPLLRSADTDVEACHAWVRREASARDSLLAPLFQRRWRIEVGEAVSVREVGARPAFEALPLLRRERWGPLRPGVSASVRGGPVAGRPPGGAPERTIAVELLVPWGAFPPLRPLQLAEIRLRVAWADPPPARPAPPSGEGPRPAWPQRRLGRPLAHRVGSCGYGLASVVIAGPPDRAARLPSDSAVAYMIPDSSGILRRLIVLDNEARGYQYEPDSTVVSPAAYDVPFPTLEIGEEERLCGPVLAYRRGVLVSPVVDSTRRAGPRPPEGAAIADLRQMATRREADGDLLVREGPRAWWTHYGSGQCGACPRVSLDVWRVDTATARVEPLFSLVRVAEPGVMDVEIVMSDDWGSITVYESDADWEADPPVVEWSATRYCRPESGGPYEVCEVRDEVDEPPARLRRAYAEPGDAGPP